MEKVNPQTVHRTTDADLDVVRKLLATAMTRIARVLNTRRGGHARASRGGQLAVKMARRKHGLDRRAGSLVDADVLTLQGTARDTRPARPRSRNTSTGYPADGIKSSRSPFQKFGAPTLMANAWRAVLIRLTHTGRVGLGDTLDTRSELFL